MCGHLCESLFRFFWAYALRCSLSRGTTILCSFSPLCRPGVLVTSSPRGRGLWPVCPRVRAAVWCESQGVLTMIFQQNGVPAAFVAIYKSGPLKLACLICSSLLLMRERRSERPSGRTHSELLWGGLTSPRSLSAAITVTSWLRAAPLLTICSVDASPSSPSASALLP